MKKSVEKFERKRGKVYMKKILKHGKQVTAFLLAVILTATLLPTEYLNNILPEKLPWMVKAAEIVHSGTDGDLKWSLDSEGCLRISGSGDYKNHAWTTYSDEIKTAIVDVDNITRTSVMFYRCSSLTSLDVAGFDTSKVTNMNGMFEGCRSLTSLDVSHFDTSSVKGMDSMFSACSSLTSLNLSGFDTSSVTDMRFMFSYCDSLTSLDLSNFDTSKVTDMNGMFFRCSSLTSLDLSNFDTSSVTQMGLMFSYCSSLTSLDVAGIGTSKVTDMNGIFAYCSSLTSLDVASFDITNVSGIDYILEECPQLSKINTPINTDSEKGELPQVDGQQWMDTSGKVYTMLPGNIDHSIVLTRGSTGGGGDTGETTIPKRITEDMLFTTKNCLYLNNETYNKMISTLRLDMADIGGDSRWGDFCIAYKTVLSDGVTGQLKRIGESLLGKLSGRDISAEKVQAELALDYVNHVDSYSAYSQSVYDACNSSISSNKKILGILKTASSSSGDLLKATASDEEIKELAKALDSIFAYGDDLKIEQDFKKILKSSEVLKKSSKVLKITGKSISAFQVGLSILTLKLTSEDMLSHYMSLVDKNSGIYTGLKVNYNRLKRQEITEYALELLDQEGIGDILNFMMDAALGADTGPSAVVAIVGVIYKVTDLLMSACGVIDLEDWQKAQFALNDQMWLQSAVSNQYINIINNYLGTVSYDTNTLKNNYQDAYELYLSCVLQTPEYLKDFSYNEVYNGTLKKDLKKYKSLLTYDQYIQSCLKNANADYTYTVNDGKATITGTSNSSSYASAKAMGDEQGFFCLDIPEEVDGYPVEAIGTGVFQNDTDIAAVSIPSSVKMIGNGAFKGCNNIQEVFFENGLEKIDQSAFEGCTNLLSADVPDTVSEIGENAFEKDVELSSSPGSQAKTYSDENGNEFVSREKTVTAISVKKMPGKTEYEMSEDLDLTGMVLEATYGDGTTEEISDGFSGFFVEKQKGENQVKIYYNGVVTDIKVQITSGECDYTIRYLDELGNEIHDPVIGTAEIGTEITLEKPQIPGFVCKDDNNNAVIGEFNVFSIIYSNLPKKDISKASVQYQNEYVETGNLIEPDVMVQLNGITLRRNVDYTVEYTNNLNVGIANIWVVGTGEYDGIVLRNFNISKKQTTEVVNGNNDTKQNNLSNPSVVNISGISLSGISKQIAAGKKIKLTAQGIPRSAPLPNLTWTSSNPKVAIVTQTGVVTVKKKTGGKSVTITATAADGSGISASWKIKSMKGVVKKIAVSGVKTVKAGKSLKLKAKVTGTKGANKKLKWTSSNTKYATVTSSGKVKTFKAGKGKKVKITAMATDGSNKKKTLTIKIK